MTEQQRIQEALDFLISQFPSYYNTENSTYLRAILLALATGDGYIASQVEAVRDNLLVVTASGRHLDRLASLYGVVRGQGAGIQDFDFKRLVPLLGMSPKQIAHVLQGVIDTIYGPYTSHANVSCAAPAPYYINPETSLRIRVDGEVIDVFFHSSDAVDLTRATAQEIATAISDRTKGRVIGSVIFNTRTGEEYVNIRTATVGSQGFIQVVGGDVQAAMRFPETRPTRQEVATWSVERYLGTDEMVYTVLEGNGPGIKSAGVKTGDYVTIRQDSGFELANCGSFIVTFVGEDYFRCRNALGVAEPTIIQNNDDDFVFYRPDLGNILLAARAATVLETGIRELTVLLPVTSPIVKRTLIGGHHFHNGLAVVTDATADTVTISAAQDFSDTGAIHVITSRPYNRNTCSSVATGEIRLVDSEGFPEYGAVYSPTERTFYYYSGKVGNTLTGVSPNPPASLADSPLKYVERYRYDGKEGSVLTGVYPDPRNIKGLEVAEAGAVYIEGFPGSYLYDPEAPFIAAKEITFLKEKISQGSSRTVISIEDVSAFPETGYFVLQNATGDQEGPIKYLGKVGTGALIIDPSHVFDRDHLEGIGLRLVRQIGPYNPRPNGQDYPVYMTSTSPARDLLAEYLRDIIAAGITIKFIISVPEQKWVVRPQLYASDPLATELV